MEMSFDAEVPREMVMDEASRLVDMEGITLLFQQALHNFQPGRSDPQALEGPGSLLSAMPAQIGLQGKWPGLLHRSSSPKRTSFPRHRASWDRAAEYIYDRDNRYQEACYGSDQDCKVLVSTHRISIYQLPSAIPALIGIGTVPAGIGRRGPATQHVFGRLCSGSLLWKWPGLQGIGIDHRSPMLLCSGSYC